MKQVLIAAVLLLVVVQSSAFQVSPLYHRQRTSSLTAKKKKRSVLGEVAASGGAPPKTTRKPTKRTSTKKSAAGEAAVSPALAEWASSSEISSSTVTVSTPQGEPDEEEEPTADTFLPFKQDTKKSSRRVKQSARKEQDEQREATVARIIDNLNTVLEEQKKSSLEDIINAIRPFLNVETGNLRLVTAGSGSKRYNYRLAWVGSDEALCHIGTGLHKVPLARMQEVFLTFQGKGRIEILEVIRILGPFPNVRNTLQGDSKVKRSSVDDDVTEWEIVMDSMIDGTGKEILAGTDENIRRVKLDVYFADPNAILAVVPPEEGVRDDPLQDNGENALLFIREDELDAKLDMMRVS